MPVALLQKSANIYLFTGVSMKIGDEVQFGADADGRPIWDFYEHRDEFDHFNTGKIAEIDSDAGEIEVEYHLTNGEEAIWVWPTKAPRDADDHWLRPATRPALVSPDDKPAWVETVNVRRKAEIPDIVISQMIDRGERGVRRSLREWPYGKTLRHETARQPGDLEDTFQIRWYWAASP
jgi:hypothetical protein